MIKEYIERQLEELRYYEPYSDEDAARARGRREAYRDLLNYIEVGMPELQEDQLVHAALEGQL